MNKKVNFPYSLEIYIKSPQKYQGYKIFHLIKQLSVVRQQLQAYTDVKPKPIGRTFAAGTILKYKPTKRIRPLCMTFRPLSKKVKKWSILKSAFVYKTAQTQLALRTYNSKIKIYAMSPLDVKILKLLETKLLKVNSFVGVEIKTRFVATELLS